MQILTRDLSIDSRIDSNMNLKVRENQITSNLMVSKFNEESQFYT